jgi:DNA polymerase III subunit gamma/tau
MSEVLYRKYRPSTFADVIDQEHVKRTIQNQIASNKHAHAYLLTGPRGVGKTTIARLVAKTLNCTNQKEGKSEPCNKCDSCKAVINGSALDIVEMDAASHTDVDNVRENIIGNVRFTPNQLQYKVFIIDEVHMLSTSAFNALLKTLEEPPAHAIFILATTEIHKVPETIISRCQRFDFKRVPIKLIVKRMKTIAKKEGIEITDDVLAEVARHSDGCMRDAESLLGQVFSLGEKKIDMETASLVLPATTTVLVIDFLEAVHKQDQARAIELVNQYVEQGIDMAHFLDDVIEFSRGMLLFSLGDKHALTDRCSKDVQKRIESIIQNSSANHLGKTIEVFLSARQQIKTSKIPQLPIELAILSLSEPVDFKRQGVASVCADDEKVSNPLASELKSEAVPLEKGDKVSETAFGSVPIISLDEVKKKWPEVFKQLQETNGTLPVVVQSGQLCDVCDDHVEITFNYEFHADLMNKEKNRKLLEKIMERVFGKPLRLRAKYQQSEADETVDELLEEFGGSVA